MNEKIAGIAIGLITGALLALIQIQTIGITAAIALPVWFNNLLLNSNHKSSLLILWEIIVVQFIGSGIPTLIITFLTLKFLLFGKYWKLSGLIAGAIATLFIIYPAPGVLLSPVITHHLYEITLVLCALSIAHFVDRRQNTQAITTIGN